MGGVLYHPYFEPSLQWLRTALLVYDQVWSIVPSDANYVSSEQIRRHLDTFPDTFAPLAPEPLDIVHEYFVLNQLGRVFKHIANSRESAPSKVRVRYSSIGEGLYTDSLEISGITRLHDTKVAYTVLQLLEESGLVYGQTDDDFLLVDERAAHVIVSLLAQRMATRLPIRTITDVETSFLLSTACDVIDSGGPVDSQAVLAASVLNFHIPEAIGELSNDRYIEIRKRYAELRELFPLYLRDLADLMQIDQIQDIPEVMDRIKTLLRSLDRDIARIKRSRVASSLKSWIPLGIGGVITLGSAFVPDTPTLKYVTGGATVAVQILSQVLSNNPIPSRLRGTQSLLLDAKEEIISTRNLSSWLDPNTLLV
jgi:hypothetical protein